MFGNGLFVVRKFEEKELKQMKFTKTLMGALFLGIGISSSMQVLAACPTSTSLISTDVTSTISYDTQKTTISSVDSTEKVYQELFYKTFKDYLNMDASMFPSNAVFKVTIEDRKSINEQDAKMLASLKESVQKKYITQADYDATKKQVEYHKNDTYDKITCTLAVPNADGTVNESYSQDNYIITFTSDTKEVIYFQAPLSADGLKLIAEEKAAKVSAKDIEKKYADFIKTHKLGGITNPKCIINKVSNKKGDLPVIIYQDQKDANKKVTITIDGATGKLNNIYVW